MLDAMMRWLPAGGDLNLTSLSALALIFFVASFVLVPRTFLCIGVGAIYGLPAVLVVLPATTLGGILAFLAARYLFAERMQRYADARPHLRKIARAVDEEGWRIVALLRFASPVPNAIQNYLFGLTRIPFLPFALTSFAFTIPQVVLYVYFGAAGSAILLEDGWSAWNRGILCVGLVSVFAAMMMIIRRVRRDDIFSEAAAKKPNR